MEVTGCTVIVWNDKTLFVRRVRAEASEGVAEKARKRLHTEDGDTRWQIADGNLLLDIDGALGNNDRVELLRLQHECDKAMQILGELDECPNGIVAAAEHAVGVIEGFAGITAQLVDEGKKLRAKAKRGAK